MGDLKLIRNELSYEDRIQHRINSFRRDIMMGDADINYINTILETIYDYLEGFEDDDLIASTYKIKEAIFYIDNFTNS